MITNDIVYFRCKTNGLGFELDLERIECEARRGGAIPPAVAIALVARVERLVDEVNKLENELWHEDDCP